MSNYKKPDNMMTMFLEILELQQYGIKVIDYDMDTRPASRRLVEIEVGDERVIETIQVINALFREAFELETLDEVAGFLEENLLSLKF